MGPRFYNSGAKEAFEKLAKVKPEIRAKRLIYKVMFNSRLQLPGAGQGTGGRRQSFCPGARPQRSAG